MFINKDLAIRLEAQLQPTSIVQETRKVSRFLQSTHAGRGMIREVGKGEMLSLVGFIDLVGFSTRVQGTSPKEVAEYLYPFLEKTISVLLPTCAIDKTIGDEIMFLLPYFDDTAEDIFYSDVHNVIDSILDLQKRLGSDYFMKLGISFGPNYLAPISQGEYHEWSVFGESVNLAKRLHSIEMDISPGVGCALGILNEFDDDHDVFKGISEYINNTSTNFSFADIGDVDDLVGVSSSRVAIMKINNNSS